MALVTIRAVVHIPIHIGVIKVGGVVTAMAARALEYRVVARIDVARRANTVCAAMSDWELRVVRVRERPGGPVARADAVACPALCSREERCVRGCGMCWACRPVVVSLVAGNASVAG